MTKTDEKITDTKLTELINEHLSSLPKTGDLVKGSVIKRKKYEILVDIDGYTTGVIRGAEIKNLPDEYTKLIPGDPIEAMVVDMENEKGQMELSLKSALVEGAWNFIKEAEKNQEVIEVRITGANKGGLLSNVRAMPSFLPVSQLIPEHYPKVEGGDKKKILKKLKTFIGQTMSVKIISSDAEEDKIIISEKRAWEETQKKRLNEFNVGDTVDATIKSLTSFGAFVEFDEGLEGLVHISEIPIPEGKEKSSLSEILPEDTEVTPRIIDIKGTRVFFSLKPVENPESVEENKA